MKPHHEPCLTGLPVIVDCPHCGRPRTLGSCGDCNDHPPLPAFGQRSTVDRLRRLVADALHSIDHRPQLDMPSIRAALELVEAAIGPPPSPTPRR